MPGSRKMPTQVGVRGEGWEGRVVARVERIVWVWASIGARERVM